jgi:acyl-CoA synthetase (AMP-forming)/AMP-acid ligase II
MLLQDVPTIAAHNASAGAFLHFEGKTLSYQQLAAHIADLSHALAVTASPGKRVVILSGNRLEFVACCFAIPAARQIMVPLNTRLSTREVAEQLADTEPAIVFTEAAYLPLLEPLVVDMRALTGARIELIVFGDASAHALGYDAWLQATAEHRAPPLPATDQDDPAWILFTSGTTGRAKGAVLSHRNLITGTCTMMASTDAGHREVVLFQFPMFHISAYTLIWFLLKGYSIVLVRSFEATACLDNIERHRITMMSIAPTMLALLLDHPKLKSADTSSLRLLTYGSSAMPVEVLKRAIAQWPQLGFGTAFGMTELAGNVLYQDSAAHRRAIEESPHLLVSCGRPMALSQVRLVDDAGQDVPTGELGELAIKGDQVFTGYWRNEAVNSSSFLEGWFLTGDIARRDEEGFYYIVDRKKDMIISGGENVYSREVERVLYQDGAVAEAAVIGTADTIWGERVTAVLRLHVPASREVIDRLDNFCRPQMAGFKRPRRWVVVESMPKNPAGKILKGELRQGLATASLGVLMDCQSDPIKPRA